MRAIDADKIVYSWQIDADGQEHDGVTLQSIIDKMPTIEPERKTGRWIDAVLPNDNGGLPVQVCDQCNTFFPLAYTGGGHRFCPNCGARMEGES